MSHLRLVFASLLAWTTSGQVSMAQDLSQPLYQAEDSAAMAFHPQPGMKGKYRANLNRIIQSRPKNAAALIQRAYLLEAAGDLVRAREDFDRALAASTGTPMERRALWSRGWARFNTGDVDGALGDWRKSVELHGGNPFWAPYTYAVGYAALDQMDQAVHWYDIAVRSSPDWGDEAGFGRRTKHWKDPERKAARAAYDAWQSGRRP